MNFSEFDFFDGLSSYVLMLLPAPKSCISAEKGGLHLSLCKNTPPNYRNKLVVDLHGKTD